MDFLQSIGIATSGLKAQSGRMRIIAENLANADSTAKTTDGDPYRRKIPSFKTFYDRELKGNVVTMGRIIEDKSNFRTRYEPGHPGADDKGYVKYPNVNSLIETMDMREAQRSYEANLNIITASRRMVSSTLEILRS